MLKIRVSLLIVCMLGFISVEAQKLSEPTIRKNSISSNILGTASYLGISYERLLFERVSAEVGIGIIGIGIGATVYPLKKIKIKQLSPFIGVKYTNHAILDGENKSATYLPVGLTYFSKHRLNFSVDIGPSYFYHQHPGYQPSQEELAKYPFTDFGLWGNLKVGFRF